MTEVLPTSVTVRLAHAALQSLAERHGIELLHIKGPAVDAALLEVRPGTAGNPREVIPRDSADADVWVNPRQVPLLLKVMAVHGWTLKLGFADDSAFAHAAVLHHESLGRADVHRAFPGVGLDAQLAFDRLWRERAPMTIAGYRCWAPSLPAQRLILVLHAVRSRTHRRDQDLRRAWFEAQALEKAAVESLAEELRAEVALAAGIGRLEQYRNHREFQLWRILSSGSEHSMVAIWAARVRASATPSEALRTAGRLLVPKRRQLQAALGRAPTNSEVFQAYADRLRLGVGEFWKLGRRVKR